MMQTRLLLLILAAVLFSAAGQLLLKSGAKSLERLGQLEFLFAAARNPFIVSGLLAWAVSTVCWLYVLRVAPLSRAYGLTSLTYLLLFLGGVLIFGEQARRVHVLGTALIIIGVACLLSGD